MFLHAGYDFTHLHNLTWINILCNSWDMIYLYIMNVFQVIHIEPLFLILFVIIKCMILA